MIESKLLSQNWKIVVEKVIIDSPLYYQRNPKKVNRKTA